MNLRNILFSGCMLLAGAFAYGQQIANLEGINYQAVAIDTDGTEVVGKDVVGKPLYNEDIGVRFTVTAGMDGTIYYQETHSTTTNENGLFALNIGTGELTADTDYTDLLSMPWINGDQWLKVEIAIGDDGEYELVSNQKFMAVPYAYYTDDIADDAITTEKILDSTILNQDYSTGSVDTRVIEDSTILNEDVSTEAIDSRTILDETIQANDIDTGAVTTSEILDSTILNEDVSTEAIDSRTILDETIQANDIDTGAVTTSEILNETILAEDIATGAVETDEILNETILNEDIANGTIDLTTKVNGELPVNNGGTGLDGSVATDGQVLIGNGTNNDFDLANLTPGAGINIINTPGGVEIESSVVGIGTAQTPNVIAPPMILAGDSWQSAPQNMDAGTCPMGSFVLVSLPENLEGLTFTGYTNDDDQVTLVLHNSNNNGNVDITNGIKPRILCIP